MAEVLQFDKKVISSAFFPTLSTADEINNNTIASNEYRSRDAKNVLTINLDNVSECLEVKDVTMELPRHKDLDLTQKGNTETENDHDGWPQTQNDFKKHSSKRSRCITENNTLQISNVISLASETSDLYFSGMDHDNCKEDTKDSLKSLNSQFDDNHSHTRSSSDESTEISHTDFHDMYTLEKMHLVFDETQSFLDIDSNMLLSSSEHSKNMFDSHIFPASSEYPIKEESTLSKAGGEQCPHVDEDQYKNIEFSAIFSSLGDYSCDQDSLDESIMSSNEQMPWVQSSANIQNSLIIDLDNQQRTTDSGICDDDDNLNATSILMERRDVQELYNEKSSFAMDYEDVFENRVTKTDCKELDWHNYFYSNHPNTSDHNLPNVGYKKLPHPQNLQTLKQTSFTSTEVMSSNLAYSDNISDRPFHDTLSQDHHEPYQLEHFYYYPNQESHTVGYSEYNKWAANGNCIPDSHDITKSCAQSSEVSRWATPSPSLKNAMSPDIIPFSQTEVTDDEETDDADEIDNLSVTFCHSKASMPFSPQSLTASPMSASTPNSSLSPESQEREDSSNCCIWPVSLTCVGKPSVSGKSLLIPQCKLSTEQLESTLFSYGMEHGVKRPYPSMADVMRKNRLAARSNCKKIDSDDCTPVHRRCGRPRKNQIQSAKISTSTSKTTKAKVKSSLKSKGCLTETMQTEAMDSENGNDFEEAGSSSNVSRSSRHNEPLNQRAVYIMSKWYADNINNPYPSKFDKEEMARYGGITENQVKSWFANKRNRTNNTKPKVQKRVMEQKLRELFKDLKHNHGNPSTDNTHIIQQLSGILQQCHSKPIE
ncbi:uncharacterized protein LOC106060265 isoform X1 [Biomphalaria glabrata]|uniref:Uncharacterized protein LOC106060265 isoform X1 n=1 Tax=Biomphalaria glabrata TaxID=6526 RepID=A0A9U8E4Z6_BIOGL|nr:uncharacterized protein LOC106060265 isoform X1 [Biomphalaria glabrata]